MDKQSRVFCGSSKVHVWQSVSRVTDFDACYMLQNYTVRLWAMIDSYWKQLLYIY